MSDDDLAHQVLISVAAMKLLLGRLWALYYTKTTLSPDDVKAAHKIMVEKWSTNPLVASSDPAISDVMSDDVLREIEKFLRGVEKDFRAMKQEQ
jgi:hypothetical protein